MVSNKKKSKKNRKPCEAIVTCPQCARAVPTWASWSDELTQETATDAHKENRIFGTVGVPCRCGRVHFCNAQCRSRALATRTHLCPASPEHGERQRTVHGPISALARGRGRNARPPQNIEGYVRYADKENNYPCAYMAGVHYYKEAIEGKGKGNKSTAEDQAQDSSESHEKACKYLTQASKGGLGLAMQALADCYELGIGVPRRSDIQCRDWLWQAALLRSAGALETLDEKSPVAQQHLTQYRHCEQSIQLLNSNQIMIGGGPFLASLFQALRRSLQRRRYVVPAFAHLTPTLKVGQSPRSGTTGPVTIVGVDALERIKDITKVMEERSVPRFCFIYGRRGFAALATATKYLEATRSVDSPLYRIPPAPGCDERMSPHEIEHFMTRERQCFTRTVLCAHAEEEGDRDGRTVCGACFHEAAKRLEAVSTGSVVLSLDEILKGRGHAALMRQHDGTFKLETFSSYARCEVESALAVLVECQQEEFGSLSAAHPLFVAADPNLFWPLVMNHGTIRAALEYVAPLVDWTKRLGKIKPPPTLAHPVMFQRRTDPPSIGPGTVLHKCGNDNCNQMEPTDRGDDSNLDEEFLVCGNCERRFYCSPECQRLDWTIHKQECSGAAAKSADETKKPPVIVATPRQSAPDSLPGGTGISPDDTGNRKRRCGNKTCNQVEPDQPSAHERFHVCGRCKKRYYCSADCQRLDWAFHKRECKATAGSPSLQLQPPAKTTTNGNHDISSANHRSSDTTPLARGEEIVVDGLLSNPEFNGCLGVITGDLQGDRYPVKLFDQSKVIGVKESHCLRLGVRFQYRKNGARKFSCTEHKLEVCSACNMDFGVVNRLSKHYFSSLTASPLEGDGEILQAAPQHLSKETIAFIAESYFAAIEVPENLKRRESRYSHTRFKEEDTHFPIECQGLELSNKRKLRALLHASQKEKSEVSMTVVAAISALSCYSARTELMARPMTLPILQRLVSML